MSGITRAASAILLRCACTAGNVARLAIVVYVGPEPGIALVLARSRLQLHLSLVRLTSNGVRTQVALGARGVQGVGALLAFLSALRATLVNHVWEHVKWTVVYAFAALQEEPILAFLALGFLGAIANCAIWMALDADRKHVKRPGNRLHGFEEAILSVSLDQGILAAFDTVRRGVENH